MGHLNKGDEAQAALDDYLKLRPNLKTKEDYKKYICSQLFTGRCLN